MNAELSFPPLLTGRAVAGDPFAAAIQAAQDGCDAGLVLYDPVSPDLQAALVLAPEVALAEAAVMLPLAGVALQNAVGSVAPPEVALQLGWSGKVHVNGAKAGQLRMVAPKGDRNSPPDWMVIGLSLRFVSDDIDGGQNPDETALHAEGCGDLMPLDVLESWSRHLLTQLHIWEQDGIAPLHREYSGLVFGMGDAIDQSGHSGTFLGLDEQLGMLVKTGEGTRLVPLTDLLETP